MSDAISGEGQAPEPIVTAIPTTATIPPVTPPPPAVVAPEARSIDVLPAWAQAEIRDLRGESAKRRTDQKAAEDARLKEQGEWQRLYEGKDKELTDLRADIGRRERLDLARAACEQIKLPTVFAERLHGETAADLLADAKAFLAAMPMPIAASTENGRGSGSGTTGREALIQKTVEELRQRR